MSDPLRAVILAGGLGMRLRPYTTILPKPLVPVGDRPILEHIIRRLHASGVRTVDLCVGHLGELIQVYFSQWDSLPHDLELRWHWEEEPLGTAGALRLVPDLGGTFIAMNGDVLTTLDYAELVRFHEASGAALTVATHAQRVDIDLGVIETEGERIVGYREKPKLDYEVSMGIYVYDERALGHLPAEGRLPVPRPRPAPARRRRGGRRLPQRGRVVRHRHPGRAPAGGRSLRELARGLRVSDAELDRIRTEYRARDAATDSPYRWDNPGYVSYMQGLERSLLRAFADAGVPLAGARVLDVGCGSGYFLHRLTEYGAGEAHGIDLMEDRVAEGRKRYPALQLQVGSATELPYADGEFDLVTQFTCLSSILDDDVRLAVAREMRRVAAGGWVLSFDMRGLRRPGSRREAARNADRSDRRSRTAAALRRAGATAPRWRSPSSSPS